jgi:hypothetical protein
VDYTSWDDYLKVAAKPALSHADQVPLKRDQLGCGGPICQSFWSLKPIPSSDSPSSTRRNLRSLRLPGYIKHHQNIIWLGGPGCGKTGLATGFIHAIDQGYNGRYIFLPNWSTNSTSRWPSHRSAGAQKFRLRLPDHP